MTFADLLGTRFMDTRLHGTFRGCDGWMSTAVCVTASSGGLLLCFCGIFSVAMYYECPLCPFVPSFHFHLYLFTIAQNINYLNTLVQFLVFFFFISHTFQTLIIIITSAVESANYQQPLSWRAGTSRCEPVLGVRLIYRATPLRFRSILLRYLRSLKT